MYIVTSFHKKTYTKKRNYSIMIPVAVLCKKLRKILDKSCVEWQMLEHLSFTATFNIYLLCSNISYKAINCLQFFQKITKPPMIFALNVSVHLAPAKIVFLEQKGGVKYMKYHSYYPCVTA